MVNFLQDFKSLSFSLFIFFILSNASTATAQENDSYDIKIEVKNFKDKSLSLGYHYGDKQYILDSAKVGEGSSFRFHQNKKINNGIYFFYSNSMYMEFVLGDENRKFSFETDTLDYVKNLKIFGSKENQQFNRYQLFLAKQRLKSQNLQKELQKNKKDEGIKKTLRNINASVKNYQDSIIRSYPTFMVSKILKATSTVEVPTFEGKENSNLLRYNYYKKHFFDNIDFSDNSLLRTPIVWSKVEEYLGKVVSQNPDSVAKASRFILEKSKANEEAFKYFLNTITSKYENAEIMGMENVFVDLAEQYYLTGQADWLSEDLLSKIEKRVKELRPNLIGKKAPILHLVDTTLVEPIYLEHINNPFVVLYFYDPDCGHCKKETPKLSEAYEKELSKYGVQILAVPTITDSKRWKEYVNKNKDLPWMHAADPYVRSNFRADYNLKTTPQIFVLDKNKKIIAKKLEAEQLTGFIKNYSKYH